MRLEREACLPTLWKAIMGVGGGIEVPFIGIHVADIGNWKAQRRGEEGPDSDLFDLHAALSFVNHAIWSDAEYEKEITVALGRGRSRYRVAQQEGFRPPALAGRSLTIEGVKLWRVET